MNDILVTVVIEDDLSIAIIKRLLKDLDTRYRIDKIIPETRRCSVSRGNAYIQNKIKAFNKAAQYQKYIILTDLDLKSCAPSYVKELINEDINDNLLLQIAVREVEAWLIADSKNFSSFLGVSKDLFKTDPEIIDDPKSYIFSLTKRSKKTEIKKGIPPKDKTARFGPFYNQILIDFVTNHWDFNKAKMHSYSLNRFINKIKN